MDGIFYTLGKGREEILTTLRASADKPNEYMSNFASGFLLLFLLICGHILFFYNPDNVIQHIRTPVIIIYVLLVAFVSFFILKRINDKPMFNLSLELRNHTFTFGKMLLLVFLIYISFYILYKVGLHILLKTIDVSIFLTIAILIVSLAIINSYTKIADDETTNEFVDFIKDLIFYIPCLLVDVIEYVKKDYRETPSTVLILFIILVVICLLYTGTMYVNFNNPLLLIDKPCYLDTEQVSLNHLQLENLIIKSRPWYEQELLRLQHKDDKKVHATYDTNTNVIKEGFTSILASETIPVHLSISEYDKYILAQAMYGDDSIKDTLKDISGNVQKYIDFIVRQQEKIMSLYEKLLLNLAIYSSKNLSQTLLGNLKGNKYHYSLSYWIYLFSDQTIGGKDTILKYGSRPSMYYDHAKKELSVEILQEGKQVVLYGSTNILFQRWNHVVMNYDHGTFDLFINNNLVSTNSGVVTYVSPTELLQVGFTSNNNLGGIAQLLYSEQPLKLNQIGTLYLQQPKI
jgi:hypothetical protein